VRKRVERVSAFFCLEVPIIAGVLASEPDNTRAFITGPSTLMFASLNSRRFLEMVPWGK